jgi:tRNA-Thr(GGU) m(6)t(6)A37 methyltransferase TsaA
MKSAPAPMLSVPIIGYLRSPLVEKFGIPRQPNLVDIPAIIEFVPPYDDPHAFVGLTEFSHVWLVWQFHHNKDQRFRPMIRPPRLGGNHKVGVFASRSMYRPAPLGLSVVKRGRLIEQHGKMSLEVLGADLLDGTPIIDLKPYIRYSDAINSAVSGFAPDAPARLAVVWQAQAQIAQQHVLQQGLISAPSLLHIEQLLSLDPRPAYQDDTREYGMAFGQVNIKFCVIDDVVNVIGIDAR